MTRAMRVGWLVALLAGCAGHQHPGLPRPSREGYVTTSDSARLYYRITGSGPDTIIAIHGGPGVDLESIAADFAPLEARHVVVFYDQRGAGRSELPADTMRLVVARQIADLDEVRTRLGLGRVTLVAHSYGPLLAASYALAHPEAVRRMVFFGPVPPRRGDFWQRFASAMRAPSARTGGSPIRLPISGRPAGTSGPSGSSRGWPTRPGPWCSSDPICVRPTLAAFATVS